MKILVVEDEQALADGLKFNFEQEGFDVVLAGDGPTALGHFKEDARSFDLVILDLMLPCMSGYETCEAIREIDDEIPVLVLSARTLSQDKAQAFDAGTDQYMTKPFALPELLARVRNLLERSQRTRSKGEPTETNGHPPSNFQFDQVVVNYDTFELTIDGETHPLTTMEMDLLRYFIENEGKVLSRAEILENVWGEPSDISTRSIDNFVMRLRKLTEPNPSEPVHFLSVRGTGYRFVAQTTAAN
jgi:two-component system OmpR family response regulator